MPEVITLDLGAVGGRSYQTQAVRTILRRHPRSKIVIAHLAQPPISQSTDHEQILLTQYPKQLSLP